MTTATTYKTTTHRPAKRTGKSSAADILAIAACGIHYVPLLATAGWLLLLLGVDLGAGLALVGMLVAFVSHPIVMLNFSAVRSAKVFVSVARNFPLFPTNLAAAAIASLAVLLATLAIEVFVPGILTIRAANR